MELFNERQIENRIDYFSPSNYDYKIRVVNTSSKKVDTAIVFIHGAPGSADSFYRYLSDSLLLEKAHLYAIDRPGYGYSNFGKPLTSIEEQTRIISNVIDSLPQHYVLVVGHSYGGPIAAYSSLFSDKVKSVMMLAPAIDPENEKIFWFANISKWKLTKWMVPGALCVAGEEKFTHVEELKKVKNVWPSVNVPIVHMHGKKDNIVPFENVPFSKENFNEEHLKVIELPLENHFIPWTQHALIVDEILELLEK
ncbi:alpha/beta hydrolase [Leptobacterium sp. I13]|uniref:alpha/beta fold hydrolase n=1 Tax=Leptobacterium meishanense TaxID=3128904 RepID=UPI0030EB74A2